jgi:hypothetical protein
MEWLSSAASKSRKIRETPPPERESDVVDRAYRLLRARLPDSWTIEPERDPEQRPDRGVDGLFRLSAPDGENVIVLVQAKRLLNTREVPMTIESLARAASAWGSDQVVLPLLAARYLAPATRERIAAAGAAYADATGNLRMQLDRPALFVSDRGEDRDPWRGPGRPRGTLQGPPAARVVRALADFAPPMTVPELAKRAGASTGATYRVVDFIEGEGLLERRRHGPILDVRWRGLLERWSRDYGFGGSNTTAGFLEPRGLLALVDRLRNVGPPDEQDVRYAVTGSLAAQRLAPHAPPRLATLYVEDIASAADRLDLRPTETGANVVLAAGDYDVVFERADFVDGVMYAAPSQVAVDLLTGPGRNPSEGVALLDWMERNEQQWRR